MSNRYVNKSKLMGKIGTENYRVSNCPFHLPKENVKFFRAMQDAGSKDPFNFDFNNQVETDNWKNPVKESFDFNSTSGLLFEGSWGYDPNDGDGPLDMRFDINLSMFESVYDKCKKCIDDAEKKHEPDQAWDAIGNIEYFFDRATMLDNLADDPKRDFEKYDFWWKLKQRKGKDIIQLYQKALKLCAKDKQWINGWREPKRMLASLKRRHKFIDKLFRIQKRKDDYEKKLKEKRKKIEAKEKAQPEIIEDDVVTEGFMFEGECGGVEGCTYNTPMNTVGVGNVIPAGQPAMTGAAQASDMFNGSGDITIPASSKKKKKSKKKEETIYFPIAVKK